MTKKIIITPKEIAIVLGCSDGYARKIHRNIRKELKREDHTNITIKEFCDHFGFTIEEVIEALYPTKVKSQ